MRLSSKERLAAVLSSFENRSESVEKKPTLSADEIRFKSLLIVMEKESVSFRNAVKIVGGRVRLTKLIESNKIRAEKDNGSQNNKWKINAADCYRNIKPRVEGIVAI